MAKPTTPAEASAPRRRRADAERSVAAILDAALEALASDPDSSMAEIARRAGVVRATIYVHFPTRTTLLDAVMEHAVAEVAEATRGAEPQRGEPEEALERVLRATWRELALPRSADHQHDPAFAGGTPPSPPSRPRAAGAVDRARPEGRRVPERPPAGMAPRRDPRDRAHRQQRDPGRPAPRVRSRGRDAQHGDLGDFSAAALAG